MFLAVVHQAPRNSQQNEIADATLSRTRVVSAHPVSHGDIAELDAAQARWRCSWLDRNAHRAVIICASKQFPVSPPLHPRPRRRVTPKGPGRGGHLPQKSITPTFRKCCWTTRRHLPQFSLLFCTPLTTCGIAVVFVVLLHDAYQKNHIFYQPPPQFAPFCTNPPPHPPPHPIPFLTQPPPHFFHPKKTHLHCFVPNPPPPRPFLTKKNQSVPILTKKKPHWHHFCTRKPPDGVWGVFW